MLREALPRGLIRGTDQQRGQAAPVLLLMETYALLT